MISRWLISFNLALFVSCAPVWGASAVTGSVSLANSKLAAVRDSKDYSGVVVWLEPVGGRAIPKPAGRAQLIQKNKTFLPHVLAVVMGTTVDFPNFDPIFHNAFSNFDGKVFDIGLYAPGTSRAVRMDRPGVVRVFCNIHPSMSAMIAVLPTPYFAVSQRDGKYQIDGVPRGEYTLRVLHERATPATLNALSRRVVVQDDGLAVPEVAISEDGYLHVPHNNKFGKKYRAPKEDSLYPGAAR